MLLVTEIAWQNPLDVAALWAEATGTVLLDSAAESDPRARYTYLGIDPFHRLAVTGRDVTLDDAPVEGDPFAVLSNLLARFRLSTGSAPVPFGGGAIGYLGYEMGRWLEKLPARHGEIGSLPDMAVGFYDLVIAWDLAARRMFVLASGFPEEDPDRRQARARARTEACIARLQHLHPLPPLSDIAIPWQADLDPAPYEARLRAVLEHIRAGDIFQANFTAGFRAEMPVHISAFDLYRRLRHASPAPFAAFLRNGGSMAIASASPERFLSLAAGGHIEARPIKGTRPRGRTPAEDERFRRDLEDSAKDRAENLMIVDLIRNDLGRVAALGSVTVPALYELESFASVHHLVSAVTAQLRPGLGAVDLLRATFPGGSVTGAPKIRAMQIIDALEESRRGPYCGAILWIGFDGAMDSSIVIRTLALSPEGLVAQAGGGIVADSDPAAEYRELRLKAAPLLGVLGGIVAGEDAE